MRTFCSDQWKLYVSFLGISPAGPVWFCFSMSAGAGVPGKIHSWSVGAFLKVSSEVRKFFATTLLGVLSMSSVTRKVFSSEKAPSSNTARPRVLALHVTYIPRMQRTQKKLAPVLQRLDGVRNPSREEPNIARRHFVQEILAILVDGADARASVQHESPLGGLVPMQLAVRVGRQSHIHTRHGSRNGKLILVLVSSPPRTGKAVAVVGKTKGPFCVANVALVGPRWDEKVAVQPVVGFRSGRLYQDSSST